MIAFKGFTEDLTANCGKGIYQYELGKTYIEEKARQDQQDSTAQSTS